MAVATATTAPRKTAPCDSVPVKYMRLNVTSGYGARGQFGPSKVRFLYIPAQAREPRPADGDVWPFSTQEYALIDGFQTYIDNLRFG